MSGEGNGERSLRWLRRAVGGSVSRTVARKAGCPVATLTNPADWPAGLRPRGVLYATDHPEPDPSSFALAYELAEARAGELTVLYVPPRLWTQQGRRAEGQWRRLTALVPGCRLLVRHGPTTDVVLGTASGTDPGFLIGSMHAALNPDPYTMYTYNPPSGAILKHPTGYVGVGKSQALFQPAQSQVAGMVGTTIHHLLLVLDPITSAVVFVSAPVPGTFVP